MKQRHYYLNKLGIKSDDPCIFNTGNRQDSQKQYKKERLKHGFDSRELWSMEYTSACWLYEHINLYKEKAGKIVDLNFFTYYIPILYEIPNDELEYIEGSKLPKKYLQEQIETRTQLEAINFIIQYLEFYLKHETDEETEEDLDKINKNEQIVYEYLQGAFRIYAEILPSMWW